MIEDVKCFSQSLDKISTGEAGPVHFTWEMSIETVLGCWYVFIYTEVDRSAVCLSLV